MANTSDDLQLPAPVTVLASGKLVAAPDSVEAAGHCNNWLIARGGCTPLMEQGWQGTALVWNGAAQIVNTAWRIPAVSGAHTKVDVVVNYTQAGAVGQIAALSAGAGATVAAPTAVGGPTELTLAGLQVAAPYDEITLRLTSLGGNLTIHDAYAEPSYLANPLPAAAVDGASPMGVGALAEENPLHGRIHADFLTNLPILRQRPRVLGCWSGLISGVGQETLRTGIRWRSPTRTWQGSVAKGVTYHAHAYVRNTTGAATRLIWQAGAFDWEQPTNIVGVAAFFTGWKETTITLPDQALVPGYPWEAVSVGLDIGIGAYPTTCEVLAFVVWGE